MFRDIVEPSVRVGNRRRFAVPLSILSHVLVVSVVVLVPLLAPTMLPAPAVALVAFVAPGDIPLPPPPPPPPAPRIRSRSEPQEQVNPGAAPLQAPDTIAPEREGDLTPLPVGVVEGSDGLVAGLGSTVLPVAPPPAPVSAAPTRIGGKVRPPAKIKDVKPVYPAIAMNAHVEGVVILEITIGETGAVLDARVLRSVPLLDAAALDAVRGWEFTPTLLNGVPISVVMTVTVRFALN